MLPDRALPTAEVEVERQRIIAVRESPHRPAEERVETVDLKLADLVVLDAALRVQRVYVAGERVVSGQLTTD